MNWFGSVGAQLTAAESADLQSVLEELDVSVGNSQGDIHPKWNCMKMLLNLPLVVQEHLQIFNLIIQYFITPPPKTKKTHESSSYFIFGNCFNMYIHIKVLNLKWFESSLFSC